MQVLRKVYSARQRRREVPQIKLQGHWLAAAGLEIGSEISVTVEHGRVIVELACAAQVLVFPQPTPQLAAA